MSFFTPKAWIKRLIKNQGYDISLYPIARSPYTGANVVFVHIAKCGGSSVDYALRRALAASGQPRVDRQSSIASSMATFEGEVGTLEGSCRFSEHHAAHLHKVLAYYLQQNWQYISGHITITEQLINRYQDNYAFITILREPVERFISNYIFNKLTNKQNIMLPNYLSTDNVINEAKEILNSKRGWQMANLPTMYLTGRYPKDENDAIAMQSEIANNLAKFKVVGFLDNLSQFEQEVYQLTGKEIKIGKRNTTKQHQQTDNLHIKETLQAFFAEPNTLKQVEHLCRFEILNYQYAKEL